jgi:predicted nucleic acid-binding protein
VSPRTPTPVLVVDANIIVSVALGLRSRPVFAVAHSRRSLLTSARAREEVLGTVSDPKIGSTKAVEFAQDLLDIVTVVDAALYADRLERAAETLRQAVASRNGSTKDAHILALAWTLDADIWSHDRDFAGTGWPSWSNANLLACLEREPPQ